LFVHAQNVGIGTTTPSARLEIKNPVRSTVKISSNNFIDTSQLIFSNRNISNVGTDMQITSNRESGLRVSSSSDIAVNNKDTIMQITPTGLVGIRTATPQYPLDVKGDMNVTGELKANGVAGTEGQFLRSNGNGTMSWDDQCDYKNFKVFNYTTPSAIQTFTVPTGVTKVKAKIWGGGGNGAISFAPNFAAAGGAGGGYAEAVFLNPTSLEVIVAQGATTSLEYSQVLYPSTIIFIRAGNGENSTIASGFLTLGRGGGGALSNSNPFFIENYIFMQGKSGTMDTKNYYQISSTAFGMLMNTGMGGDAANTENTGAQSGRVNYNITALTYFSPSYTVNSGLVPGGGGAGGGSGVNAGANGMVILYW
ncbi:MAG: hypothetical protein LH615_08470, partial [Ferruginibacter sp.]|nr:hypothetical protein [Ferruginibacter sp.]